MVLLKQCLTAAVLLQLWSRQWLPQLICIESFCCNLPLVTHGPETWVKRWMKLSRFSPVTSIGNVHTFVPVSIIWLPSHYINSLGSICPHCKEPYNKKWYVLLMKEQFKVDFMRKEYLWFLGVSGNWRIQVPTLPQNNGKQEQVAESSKTKYLL